ncbi:DUF3090 family protein [bacterium]|jgi:uncharacterized repeat protein (TIGR03847 family)|nr:DUF3090 family protein [bacterium]
MAEQRDFGAASYVAAEALGQPGQRRFRVRALNESGEAATLWLEKEQLNALGDAIETALRAESYQYQRQPLDDRAPDPVLPLDAAVEMQIQQLSMGINRDAQQVVIIASDGDPDELATSTLTVAFDYRRAYELRRQITDTVAAGRPLCPLCSAPMDPSGHVCVRSNGHHPH